MASSGEELVVRAFGWGGSAAILLFRKHSENTQNIHEAQDTCAQGGRSGCVIRGWVRKSGVPKVEGAAFREAELIDLGEI